MAAWTGFEITGFTGDRTIAARLAEMVCVDGATLKRMAVDDHDGRVHVRLEFEASAPHDQLLDCWLQAQAVLEDATGRLTAPAVAPG